MKRIAVILRQTSAVNIFRESICQTLRLNDIDSALICSGFFQENGSYSLSDSFDISMVRGCFPLELTTVGIYNWAQMNEYLTFGSGLIGFNCSICISVSQRVIKSNKWHAKIFIAKSKGQPKLAIIGSSNMTRPAFGITSPFNHECDVIFWDEKEKVVDDIMNGIIDADRLNTDGPNVFVALYDENHPANAVSMSQKLLALEAQIFSLSNAI